jgi:hypothetical protein
LAADLSSAARDFVDLMVQLRQPYALIGGAAVSTWLPGRARRDLDVLVALAAVKPLVRLAAEHGFKVISRGGIAPILRHASGIVVDVLPALTRTEQAALSEVTSRKLGRATVSVASPAALIALKVEAIDGEPAREDKDLPDIHRLLPLTSSRAVKRRLEPRYHRTLDRLLQAAASVPTVLVYQDHRYVLAVMRSPR